MVKILFNEWHFGRWKVDEDNVSLDFVVNLVVFADARRK